MLSIIFGFLTAFRVEPSAAAEPGALDNTTELLSAQKDIIVREVEIERHYLQYVRLAMHGPKWRWLRYPLLQNASSGCSLARTCIALPERAKNLQTPKKVSRHVLKGARVTWLVGTIEGAASSGLELESNCMLAIKNKIEKHDPATAKRQFAQDLHGLDDALSRMDILLEKNASTPAVAILTEEQKLFKLYRDWDVYEFGQFYASIKSRQSSNNVFYVLNILANSAEAAAQGLNIRGLRNSRCYGPSSICSIVDDCICIASAPASHWSRIILSKYYMGKFASELKEKPYNPQEAAFAQVSIIKKQVASADNKTMDQLGSINSRICSYENWNNRYNEYNAKVQDQLRHLRKISKQNLVAGPLLGTVSLGSDIQGLLTYYPYRHVAKTGNALAFGALITGGASTSAGIWLTTQWLFRDAIYTSKLQKKHALPDDNLAERLHTLEEVEQQVGVVPGHHSHLESK